MTVAAILAATVFAMPPAQARLLPSAAYKYDWDGLPPRTSLVELVTTFGRFRLAMGYLTYWAFLKKEPVALDDEGLRMFVGDLAVQFTMPGGTDSGSDLWDTRAFDMKTGEVDPDHFTVFLDRFVKPDLKRHVPAEVAALSERPPDQLINSFKPNAGESPGKFRFYAGSTFAQKTHERVGFHLDCSGADTNCVGHVYFENMGWSAQIAFPASRAADVFSICAEASELLAAWTIPGTFGKLPSIPAR